ncbi:MAG: hypothetical protein FWG70_05055 [Oscillospiraceae bacterium]|nr:hypothetical protein [Oscillospiraceae bacterium]
MRRIVFILLIVAVIAVIGLYTFLEFRVNEIVFVNDRMETWAQGKEMVVRRLYNSDVDIDAFFEKVEQSLVIAEFTEDEIYAAALNSGNPEFQPVFYFSTYSPDADVNVFDVSSRVVQEYAPNQTNFNFKAANLYIEIMTDGPMISDVELRAENPAEKIPGTPIISDDKRQMAIDLNNVSSYSFTLTGTGRVTFQYTYDVVTGNLFSSMSLEEQLLIVHANISEWQDGEFKVEYINEPFSSLEEFLY